ncbi:putative neutral sphingomyelinase [Antedon mediterranea]|uniref:putative neutral sphingomyelinase n=1 Tax=Antedon mediterranea TaxID=105859 RepID=UPI003AF82BCD
MSGKHATLQVLTLNCWGVPYLSKDKEIRFKKIIQELAKGDYDIVALQEVFTNSDIKDLQEGLKNVLPYSHYFYSGFIGSGVCIFSKGPILDTAQKAFSLNAFPHKIRHCDWYAKKLVGLCQVEIDGLRINVYTTHMTAMYGPSHHENFIDQDEYYAHRLVQSYELSSFVRQTCQSSDVNLVMGDFNSEESSLSMQIIRTNANLKDAWQERPNKEDGNLGNTCDKPNNLYTHMKKKEEELTEGIRIDYIMYNGNGKDIICRDCCLTMGQIPGFDIFYSDHEGVRATLDIVTKDETDGSDPAKGTELQTVLNKMTGVLEKAKLENIKQQGFYWQAILLLVAMYILKALVLGALTFFVDLIFTVATILGMWGLFWTAVVEKRFEFWGLTATVEDVKTRISFVQRLYQAFK